MVLKKKKGENSLDWPVMKNPIVRDGTGDLTERSRGKRHPTKRKKKEGKALINIGDLSLEPKVVGLSWLGP